MIENASFSRRQLYDLVWTKPVEQVAARFGISGRGLGKLCERHGIPVPPRGYWARKAAGQKVVRPLLIEVPMAGRETAIEFQLPTPLTKTTETQASGDPYSAMWAEQIEVVGAIDVPAKISNHPHPIVARVLEEDRVQRERARAMGGRGYFPLIADSPFERRKLRVIDVVLKRLEDLGLQVESDSRRGPRFTVRAQRDSVEFSVTEHIRQTRRTLTPKEQAERTWSKASWALEREQTGRCQLKILTWTPRSVPATFHETDEPTGEPLRKFVAALIVALAQARESREKYECEERRRREAQERARRLEEERQAELARKADLRRDAAAWREAALIREYVIAIRASATEGSNVLPADRLESWAAWALAHADEIDPMVANQGAVSSG